MTAGPTAWGAGVDGGSLIEARNLTKSFGGTKAVDCVSLCVKRGSITGLLGINGAGKSTLMRLLCGALRADEGTILIAGRSIDADPIAARCALGYLPEAPGGFEDLTIGEMLAFAAAARGVPRAKVPWAVSSAARQLDVAGALDKVIGTLSKGLRQRAWLAQAIIHNPPVLLLDEPTDGLDPAQKTALRGFLRALAETKAILMSTHILEEAEDVCDRIVILSHGCVAANADKPDLMSCDGRLGSAFAKYTRSV